MRVYNAMKERWEDDSSPEWQRYYAEKKAHEAKCEAIKPIRENFADDKSFESAMCDWRMKLFCDAPNKPGYLYANND